MTERKEIKRKDAWQLNMQPRQFEEKEGWMECQHKIYKLVFLRWREIVFIL